MSYIPFHKSFIPFSTINRIKDVLKSGWITTGPNTQKFETQFSEIIESKFANAVSSCTAALHLAYLALGIGPGDEVIVPSYTFCSSINTIIHTGAIPVFCDIDEDTLCVSSKHIIPKITKKTKAVVVVHFAGMPVDMDDINKMAKKYSLKVVEDAAHAFFTKYKGKYIGSGPNITCFSFYATKNLTTGEGGMIVSPNQKLSSYIKMLSLHGISRNAWKRYSKGGTWRYDVLYPGYKYNMTDIQAAIGLEQLKVINKLQKRRLQLLTIYRKELSRNRNIVLPIDPPYPNSQHAWHLFTIRITKNSPLSRDQLIEELRKLEIGVSVHFIPNHTQTLYKRMTKNKVNLPNTEKIGKEILSLPFYIDLTDNEVRRITREINRLTA